MDFIQTVNKQVDKFGPGKHGFSAGNPAGGVPATYFSPDWADDLQQELINIVEAAGLVPAAATRNQILLALRAAGVFSTAAALDNTTKAATTAFVRNELLALGNAAYAAIFGSLKGNSGYQRLPGGLILQWQGVSITGNVDLTASFPIAFPTGVLSVHATGDYTPGSGGQAYYNVGVISLSQFVLRATSSIASRIFSIGY